MGEKKKEKKVLQWHPAFYAGIQIEFGEEAEKLIFENEHNLSSKPLQIDVLVIKKQSGEVVRKNIGQIFRKNNIVEYKSPKDYLSIDDYYKVYAYTCLYKADTGNADEIRIEEVTMTLVSEGYPRKLMKHLQKQRNLLVERHSSGIYYVKGEIFPIQIIVTKRLPKEENFWLRNMTTNLTQKEAEELIYAYEGHEKDNLYKSVMDVIVRANEDEFEEMKRMCDALLELMKDEIDECKEIARQEGLNEGVSQGKQEQLQLLIEKKIVKGKSIEQIADELEESVEDILPLYQKVMEQLNK